MRTSCRNGNEQSLVVPSYEGLGQVEKELLVNIVSLWPIRDFDKWIQLKKKINYFKTFVFKVDIENDNLNENL